MAEVTDYDDTGVRAMMLRGGTSRGLFFESGAQPAAPAGRDDQLQLLLAGQQFHDPAAEHAVAADDQDAPAPLAHRRNRAAISGVGTKRVSLRPKKRSRLAASIS